MVRGELFMYSSSTFPSLAVNGVVDAEHPKKMEKRRDSWLILPTSC